MRCLLYYIKNYNDKSCVPIMNALNPWTKYGLQQYILNSIDDANYCTIKQLKKMICL